MFELISTNNESKYKNMKNVTSIITDPLSVSFAAIRESFSTFMLRGKGDVHRPNGKWLCEVPQQDSCPTEIILEGILWGYSSFR